MPLLADLADVLWQALWNHHVGAALIAVALLLRVVIGLLRWSDRQHAADRARMRAAATRGERA